MSFFIHRAYEENVRRCDSRKRDERWRKWMNERKMEKGNNWLAFSTLNMHGMRMINTPAQHARSVERVESEWTSEQGEPIGNPKLTSTNKKNQFYFTSHRRSQLSNHACNVVWPFSCKFQPITYVALHQALTLLTGRTEERHPLSTISFNYTHAALAKLLCSWIDHEAMHSLMQPNYFSFFLGDKIAVESSSASISNYLSASSAASLWSNL